MKQIKFRVVVRCTALVGTFCAALAMQNVLAQQPPGPPRIDFAQALAITPEKAAQVDAILKEAREQTRAAHERARAKLAQVLTAEQLQRLEELLPHPPMGPGRSPGISMKPPGPERASDR